MPAKQPDPQRHIRTDIKHDGDDQPADERIRVGSPADLLAVIPFLLGFEPSESIVILGTKEPGSTVALTLRYDILDPGKPVPVVRHAAGIFGAQGITAACVVGYGPGELVTPVADDLRWRFPGAGITVGEVLRVQDRRYWSYLCADAGCCPAEGTPFDLGSHPLTLRRALAGPVLANREALAATVAPVTGEAAESMSTATRAAEQRADQLVRLAGLPRADASRRGALLPAGLEAVARVLHLYRGGGRLESHEDAAWLTRMLGNVRIRDDAWARMLAEHRGAHVRLWRDLTVLARPGYVAAAASLLAFCAWQDGNGALANVALDRALADDPRYSMAGLLRQALDSGAPPSMARLPMTPEEVAEAYDAVEKAGAARRRTARLRATGGAASEDHGPGTPTQP